MAYPFISVPIRIDGTREKIKFEGAEITVEIYAGHRYGPEASEELPDKPVQTIHLNFPKADFPMPNLVTSRLKGRSVAIPRHPLDPELNDENGQPKDPPPPPHRIQTSVLHPSYWWAFHRNGIGVGRPADQKNFRVNPRIRKQNRGREFVYDEDYSPIYRPVDIHVGRLYNYHHPGWTVAPQDVVRTLAPRHGDYRLIAAQKEVTSETFQPHRYYHDLKRRLAHGFSGRSSNVVRGADLGRPLVPKLAYWTPKFPDLPADEDSEARPDRKIESEPKNHPQLLGDFDNGFGYVVDGAYINKPDEGNTRVNRRNNAEVTPDVEKLIKTASLVPYFAYPHEQEISSPTFFSPNRQIPSPVMFGSLPVGIKRGKPWETLLFRPQQDHPGAEDPPDHLLLDLFWMPVVEPYAISEPFSTAGKINLNYQIQPFTHITRSTGMYGVLKSDEILSIHSRMAKDYKRHNKRSIEKSDKARRPIDIGETLIQFEERFRENRIFKTASEICEIHLVPTDVGGLKKLESDFWEKNPLTGDNSRERPYANIYPRVTTKSNTYRVHYRVESLRQSPLSPSDPAERRTDQEYGIFDPDLDEMVGRYQGSTLIERLIDPAHPAIPDYATEKDSATPLNHFYTFRIVSKRRFAP